MQYLKSYSMALDPDHSVWVCANAGSGKTTALTNRVIRLLLENVSPEKILCLTYTRAAATEMVERVYSQLSQFVILDDIELERALKKLTYLDEVSHLTARARMLFFDLIDSNNGLRIQTLHSFCQNLLAKFPIEAGLEPNFKLVEDITPLVHEAKFRVLSSVEAFIGDSLKYLSLNISNFSLDKLVAEIVEQRSRFSVIPSFQFDKRLEQDIAVFLSGLEEQLTEKLKEGSDTDIKKYVLLQSASLNFLSCKKCFLTQRDEPLKKLISTNLSRLYPNLEEWMVARQQEYVALLERYKFNKIITASQCLFIFASQILQEYSALKKASSLLDYQDIIELTLSLLNNQEMSEWIKYKFDYRTEHLLVDEAQDISGDQWQIIDSLLAEFYAGSGAVEAARTLFVVGDDKQSIFSFQGANPELFAFMENSYKGHFSNANKKFVNVNLERSFRSAREILTFVDGVFNQNHLLRSITKMTKKIEHVVVKDDVEGKVEIWPLAPGEKELAQQILFRVKELLPQYAPRDIMILVRRRSSFLECLSNLLKQESIPIVTPERLLITEHRIAKYLLNIAKFTLLPQDDLNLACLLKSPIFELQEEELFALRSSSSHSLFRQISDCRPEVYQQLQCLLEARSKNVEEFYFYILDTLRFRERFFAYFAEDAELVCEQFLDMVSSYQRWHVDSLQSFVSWFENSSVENSHSQEDSDKLRIMTVHGAKGLQAPIVILADTTKVPRVSEKLLWNDAGECILVDKQSDHVEYTRELQQANIDDGLEEYYRLLYVAITRAEKILIICGYGSKAEIGSWYDEICKASPELVVQHKLPMDKYYNVPAQQAFQRKLILKQDCAWYNDSVNILPFNITSLAAQESSNSICKTRSKGLEIGELTHLLLDIFPKTPNIFHNKLIKFLVAKYQTFLLPEEFDLAVSMARAVLQDTKLKDLFAHSFYGEIAITGITKVKPGFYHNLYGRIDLLVMLKDKILVVDYKSNLEVPNGPQQIQVQYLKQLGLYKKIVADLYPNMQIICYLLWCNESVQLMEVPSDLLKEFSI